MFNNQTCKIMKTTKLFLFILLFSSFLFTTFAQHQLNNSFYLTPGFNKPLSDFGYPANKTERSLNTVGFGFGAGFIHYFSDEGTNPVNVGFDITFAELSVNINKISVVINDYAQEINLSSTMLAMKAGPVITIIPQSKMGLDIYSQFMLGLSGFDYHYSDYTDRASAIPQYRLVGGLRFGYNIIHFNFEYSWGQPTVKRIADNNHDIEEFRINQSFFRFGITAKFKPFD